MVDRIAELIQCTKDVDIIWGLDASQLYLQQTDREVRFCTVNDDGMKIVIWESNDIIYMMIQHYDCIVYMDSFKPDNENYYSIKILYEVVHKHCVIYGDLIFGGAVDKFFKK